MSTISAKRLHRRGSTGFQMRLRLERCCKYELQLNCKCVEFVAAGCCAGKLLRLDRTIREIGMFDNYYITFYFLTKSNSATEVATAV